MLKELGGGRLALSLSSGCRGRREFNLIRAVNKRQSLLLDSLLDLSINLAIFSRCATAKLLIWCGLGAVTLHS